MNGDGRPDLYVANDEDPNDLYINEPGGPLGFHFVDEAKAYGVADKNAGMGVAEGDFNGDGRPDLFITNSRGQPHAAYESEILKNGETGYRNVTAMFAKALDRKRRSAGATRSSTSQNSGNLDLILANGAIPVTNLKQDTEPVQVLQGLGGGSSRTRAGSSTRTACRRSSAAGSLRPTTPTTGGWRSRSTRSAGRSSCSRTRARSATGSRCR